MNTQALLAAAALASATFLGSGIARAEGPKAVEFRQINPSARVIGCTRNFERCEGVTSVRTGLVVIDIGSSYLSAGPISFVTMFQGAARPEHGLLASQVMLGGGPRYTKGRSWIQAGLGFGGAQVAPGPKTIRATSVVTHPRVPVAMLGVGTRVKAFDLPFQLSLDVGRNIGGIDDDTHFDHIYQVTANVMSTSL